MKIKQFPACVLVILLILHCPARSQNTTDSITNYLDHFMDQWHRNAAESNHDAFIGSMSPAGVYIGTDPTEHWTTAEFSAWCKPFFDRKHTWSFHKVTRNIFTGRDGTYAWFDELLETQMGLCRGSGILSKTDGAWKIEQYVLSATIPNDKMHNVTLQKKQADSLLIPGLRQAARDAETALRLKALFDEHRMNGTIVIFDPEKKEYDGYNPSRWDSGYLPASTFKIANTLIGLETGVIDTGYIFKWKGEKRRLPEWEKNLKLRDAFTVSCVPCYQELARKIGTDRMTDFLARLKYGSMDIHPGNAGLFWLEGNSRITPRQQVDFIWKLYTEKLPLKPATMKAVKSIMVNEITQEYTLSGKTGWAVRHGSNYGWFVGYLETKGKVFVVATMVEPRDQENIPDFIVARKVITLAAFRILGLIR